MSQLARRLCAAATLALALAAAAAAAPNDPIRLQVDLGDAPLRVFHARQVIPVQPGPLTLLYPKWIPGEHAPSGPVGDLTGLVFRAGGQQVPWERDREDMFTFHVQVPTGASELEVELDYLTPSGAGSFSASPAATDQLAVLAWNTVLLYPAGRASDRISFEASLKLPEGWSFATALPVASPGEGHRPGPDRWVRFLPCSLTTLVDSPVSTGAHFRAVDISGREPVHHELDLVADGEAALAITPEATAAYTRLVAEAQALFGAHHYRDYHFLLTLSDNLTSFGLEHHESSDDRVKERTLIDPEVFTLRAGLLPHEFVHSWNGKFRRPKGLATPEYQSPMVDDLLWVYEGLTSYLGDMLTARSGLWTPERYREALALIASGQTPEIRPGRRWRPLEDTARAAQLLYGSRSEGSSWRRGVDFYDEGVLLWLEVDTILRRESRGAKSLDDFVQLFHGMASGPPRIEPYTRDQLEAALGQVVPYDWHGFFEKRVYEVRAEAPLEGVTASGWKLVYTRQPNAQQKAREDADDALDLRASLGLQVTSGDGDDPGRIRDSIPGSPAARAGVAPGMKIVSVDGRTFSTDVLRDALVSAMGSDRPIELGLDNAGYRRTAMVDYHGGPRHPHLERIDGEPDVLSAILAPHAH